MDQVDSQIPDPPNESAEDSPANEGPGEELPEFAPIEDFGSLDSLPAPSDNDALLTPGDYPEVLPDENGLNENSVDQQNTEDPLLGIPPLDSLESFETPAKVPVPAKVTDLSKVGLIQLLIPLPTDDKQAILKVASCLLECGVKVSSKDLLRPKLSLGFLSEFQAVRARTLLNTIGITPDVAVVYPESTNEEPFLSLESVEAIPSNPENLQESMGAPKVFLPKNLSEIPLFCGPLPAPLELLTDLSPVSAHLPLPRTFLRDQDREESLQQLVNLSNSAPQQRKKLESQWDATLSELLEELRVKAHQRGANAVFGVHLAVFSETNHLDSQGDSIRMIVTGTACVVKE